jgi:hypothetical protein
MELTPNTVPVAGWIGGFAESDPAFAYPNPDLSSLNMLGNLDNIDKLQRQQKVLWPEFSWLTVPGDESSRCYQMFAPDISRLGYTDEGRIYSIICPQQGIYLEGVGTINVEVTVTGQRGWANETDKTLAADMTVEGKIWFSPSAKESLMGKLFWVAFDELSKEHPFPSDKEHAIIVTTHKPGDSSEPIFPLQYGTTSDFPIPDFAMHEDVAWAVGHLGVEIGDIVKTHDDFVDGFNELVMKAFNLGSGNMLHPTNVLSWNVWFTAPELVDQEEWARHAEYWRTSIDVEHKSPEGEGTSAKYYNGRPFKPGDQLVQELVKEIFEHIIKHEFNGKGKKG